MPRHAIWSPHPRIALETRLAVWQLVWPRSICMCLFCFWLKPSTWSRLPSPWVLSHLRGRHIQVPFHLTQTPTRQIQSALNKQPANTVCIVLCVCPLHFEVLSFFKCDRVLPPYASIYCRFASLSDMTNHRYIAKNSTIHKQFLNQNCWESQWEKQIQTYTQPILLFHCQKHHLSSGFKVLSLFCH